MIELVRKEARNKWNVNMTLVQKNLLRNNPSQTYLLYMVVIVFLLACTLISVYSTVISCTTLMVKIPRYTTLLICGIVLLCRLILAPHKFLHFLMCSKYLNVKLTTYFTILFQDYKYLLNIGILSNKNIYIYLHT